MTLAEQIRELCEQHQLSALSISAHKRINVGMTFSAGVHHADGTYASSGYEPIETETPSAAVRAAIEALNAKRAQSFTLLEPM